MREEKNGRMERMKILENQRRYESMREDKNGRMEMMKIFQGLMKIWKYERKLEWKNGKDENIPKINENMKREN